MTITRRAFLQLMGISATAFTMPDLPSALQSTVRILQPTDARLFPTAIAPVTSTVFPDSVYPVRKITGDWLQLPQGYIPIFIAQPMIMHDISQQIDHIEDETWAEVVAPYLAIRQFASTTAPLTLRANHGDVFLLTHSFCDDNGIWWGQTVCGWLQMHHVQRLKVPMTKNPQNLVLTIEPARQILVISENGISVAEIAASIPADVPTALTLMQLMPGTADGQPWNIHLSKNWVIHGEGSHNAFGQHVRRVVAGRVQIATTAARWLYKRVASSANVHIEVCK